MIIPGTLDLSGDRWTAFYTLLVFTGLDLTGATMNAHIRTDPDSPGLLVALATVTTAYTEGLRLVSVATVDGVKVSTVAMQVNETTMEGLPVAPALGADRELAWDFVATVNAGLNPGLPSIKQRYLKGKFTAEAGVTQ